MVSSLFLSVKKGRSWAFNMQLEMIFGFCVNWFFWALGSKVRSLYCLEKKIKKDPRQQTAGGLFCKKNKWKNQPHPPEPQEALLQPPPPPPIGLAELIENPDLIPASIKSILIDSQVSNKLLSTRNVRPSCSYFASVSFGSSRARPREGPDQPPPMIATRRADSILFSSMYDLRFWVANSVTSNITSTPCLLFNLNVCLLPGRIKKYR